MTPDLARKFAAIGQPRVLVVGDLMLDRYVWGSVDRISPEAPIQVLKVEREEERCGGAGSVAVNLAVLGARVAFATALGADAAADRLRERMQQRGVRLEAIVPLADRPTTVKTRFLARGQQVLRVDHEDASPLPGPAAKRLLAAIGPTLRQADIVLLPDYNKGVLTPELLAPLIAQCRRAGKRVLVDPARGVDPARYRGCSAISPNFVEAAEAAGLNVGRSEVDRIGRRLLRRLELEACVVTMDRDGIALYRGGQRPRKFPARARELYDITGAGDMVLSVLGLVLGAGGSWDEAVEAANLAGGLEVAKIGVVPLSREEIAAEMHRVADLERAGGSAPTKLRSREELAQIVRTLKSQGRTIVFTNGCFDLLNANHISLLRHSKSLGDVLIVATNSDESIRRLKGPSRPVLTEAERVELLSAVHHVDYVAVFPEDTPRPLLQLLQPDILVKGGDYKSKEEVVGWEIVEGYGGRIERAPMSHYHSTSRIVRKILDAHGRSDR